MPSIGSIFATLDRHCENQKQVESSDPVFPLIDPLDSYYLLNPDGDLSRTQVEFESWFKNQNIIEVTNLLFKVFEFQIACAITLSTKFTFNKLAIQGKIGTVPTVEELSLALKDHDLFIYFGHGSGIPKKTNIFFVSIATSPAIISLYDFHHRLFQAHNISPGTRFRNWMAALPLYFSDAAAAPFI